MKISGKISLAIVIGVSIFGGAIYFFDKLNKKENSQKLAEGGGDLWSKPNVSQNCENIPGLPDNAIKLATKIIDGDTFLIEGGYSVRILGIDADERGYPCYNEAKTGLEELILNKEVRLEKGKEDLDQYCRYLRYGFSGDKNISLELARQGLAVARFSPTNIEYREEIIQAEKNAKENKIGCKWSASVLRNGDMAEKSAGAEPGKTSFQWDKLTPELTGLNIVNACQAKNYYGKETIVEGKIVDAYRSKTNTVFFNLEKPYPDQCFNSVIFSSDQYKFIQAPENYYLNKNARIKGEIKEYQGKPEIILNNPSQIEVEK